VTGAWRWITFQAVTLLHDESLAEHGGSGGIRDQGLLESALDRPRNLAAYGQPDLADLCASYAFGIAKNHPFVDGNKRSAFLSLCLFAELNGVLVEASQLEATQAVLALAGGEIDEPAFAEWVRARLVQAS
jgi:death on curing protein